MISRKLIRTDLNLLVVLQILLEERNVTRAADAVAEAKVPLRDQRADHTRLALADARVAHK